MVTLDSYNLGPEPELKAPDLATAVEAQCALAEVATRNAQAKKIVAGVTPEQAETLLAWMVHQTRRGILDLERAQKPHSKLVASPVVFYGDALGVSGNCQDAAAMTHTQAKALGLGVAYHHTQSLTDSNEDHHAFCIVRIPVAEHENVEERPYLVDTTFRQFFHPDTFAEWGKKMLQFPAGKLLADQLLSKGTTALTPQSAMLYIGTHALDEYAELDRDNIVNALSQSSTFPNHWFDHKAHRYDVDLRTPAMVAQGAPVEAMDPNYKGVLANQISHRGMVTKKEQAITVGQQTP